MAAILSQPQCVKPVQAWSLQINWNQIDIEIMLVPSFQYQFNTGELLFV